MSTPGGTGGQTRATGSRCSTNRPDVLLTCYANGYGQTQQQEREPERPQHIPVDEERTSEYERDILYTVSTEQISSPLP